MHPHKALPLAVILAVSTAVTVDASDPTDAPRAPGSDHTDAQNNGLAAEADAHTWHRVSFDDGRLSLLMPGEPVARTRSRSTIGGDVETDAYLVARPSGLRASAAWTHLPTAAAIFASDKETLKKARTHLLEQFNGSEATDESIEHLGFKGSHLTYTAVGPGDGSTLVGEALLLIQGRHLFVINTLTPSTDPTGFARKLFASIAVARKK